MSKSFLAAMATLIVLTTTVAQGQTPRPSATPERVVLPIHPVHRNFAPTPPLTRTGPNGETIVPTDKSALEDISRMRAEDDHTNLLDQSHNYQYDRPFLHAVSF